jgi:hypothetical protein
MATLQKEESLITDPSPSAGQYASAMGYSCPDGGGCGTAGLWNQVGFGTFQLRANFERSVGHAWPTTNTSYACPSGPNTWYSTGLIPGRTVDFYGYNSNTTFNQSTYAGVMATVTIANQATASLYCYTPHAYHPTSPFYSGSYNFVTSFESWWGSTHSYDYSFVSAVNPPATMQPGQTVTASVTLKNTGGSTWYNEANAINNKDPRGNGAPTPMRLYTTQPGDHINPFSVNDSTWVTGNRMVLQDASVAPGANGTFSFTYKAPTTPGTYNEHFAPVAENVLKLADVGMEFDVTVPSYTYSFVTATNPPTTMTHE